MPVFPLQLFQKLLLAWFVKHGRDLPWRIKVSGSRFMIHGKKGNIRDPYRILVSELMLQQTQVARVIPKFEAFITTWPTIQLLAGATLSDVLIMWKGLGYNRRAKHLLETAKILAHTYHGEFPRDERSLRALPGFGPYMVSAVRVFAFDQDVPVVDVNVARVLTRVETGVNQLLPQEVRELASQSVPKGKSDDWHQALMDFGATICTAKSPRCLVCPLRTICRANAQAQSFGFATYAEWLATQPKSKKVSKKDMGKRFEETDRYFRGRIIDFLREGEKPMSQVQDHLLHVHKLADRARFGKIVESLVVDGLIVIRINTVSLA